MKILKKLLIQLIRSSDGKEEYSFGTLDNSILPYIYCFTFFVHKIKLIMSLLIECLYRFG